jgi:hypothetical protein
MVAQTFASWNQIARWLSDITLLRVSTDFGRVSIAARLISGGEITRERHP